MYDSFVRSVASTGGVIPTRCRFSSRLSLRLGGVVKKHKQRRTVLTFADASSLRLPSPRTSAWRPEVVRAARTSARERAPLDARMCGRDRKTDVRNAGVKNYCTKSHNEGPCGLLAGPREADFRPREESGRDRGHFFA